MKDIFKYKIAFRVPVALIVFSLLGVYFGYIKIDLWLNNSHIGGGYSFQINLDYLINLITQQFTNIINKF